MSHQSGHDNEKSGAPGEISRRRLFNLTGGFLENYHSVSNGNTIAATPYTYGTAASGSTLDTLENTPLVILWGHNPNETIFGHSNHYFQKMKKNGTKFIVVDPRYSDTASSLADQWVPLLPTTDNAMMDAMMYVIVTENLHDQAFIDKYTLGFSEDQMPEGVADNESLVAYLILSEKAIEPEFERRTDYDWLCEVAEKLGVRDAFTEGHETDRDWIEFLVNDAAQKRPEDNIPAFAELLVKRRHLLTHRPHTQNVAFEQNIQDPENNPFPTPSGKIEIFSKRLYDMHNPEIPALSHYVPATEGPEDNLTAKYPLQLITWKGRNRATPPSLPTRGYRKCSARSCGSTRRMRLIAASVTVKK